MVEKTRPSIVWNTRASVAFRKIHDTIKEESVSNAEKVRQGITDIIESLPSNPEKFPPDKFKRNNSGHFRAFERYSLRIAYKYSDSQIRILRIRHVKREPKGY